MSPWAWSGRLVRFDELLESISSNWSMEALRVLRWKKCVPWGDNQWQRLPVSYARAGATNLLGE
ncbi:MAG: hypothetical protein P8Y92_08355 [Halioglobus sp.]|jgi:hypothetical protein